MLDDSEEVRDSDGGKEIGRGMPFTEFFKDIDQPWSPRGFATAPFGMCFLTVVGDIQIPGLTTG